ncbi:putative signal recognition particle subunit SRP72 [Apostichopus japonicus]|uniref:Signal recognition particle subunit SRP72 n=1 Tax=Stichopus japonicus TaxID=307972 RepID=A0A2G8KM69_STIJA|nr:putative signal recognition particle subunit SRP72 [Apostichopus japonicus]
MPYPWHLKIYICANIPSKQGIFLSCCVSVLKLNREDAVAFKCKIVCLIHQSDFAQAIKEIANNPNLASDLMFEKAYCQYRLNKVPESLKTLRNITEPDDKVKELLGQVLYRLEEYSECLDIYKDLIKNSSDDFDEERGTNLSAVLAALQLWNAQESEDPGLSEENYELSFNKASLLAGKGKFKEALEELDHAEELCKEGLDEEDDEEAELGIIRVQRGYVLQLMGKTDKAMALYNQVVKARPSDIGLLAVASNNIISLNKDQNVFDSKKKIRATQVAGLDNKVTKHQQNILSYNRCLFYLYTNQFENCRKQLKKLKGEDGDTLVMIEAALFTREKRIEKAIETLQDYISKENASIRVKLSLAQLFLSQGHVNKACDVLQALGDDQYAPGVVSTLVALYTNMDDVDSALKVLDGAVSWYKTQGANPDDIKTLAQLISAYSKFDPKRAQELSQELPPVKELSGNIDVDALETTPLSVTTRQLKKGATVPATEEKVTGGPAAPETEQKKRKKKRKAKLPKNYDPSATPDPERWQPMRERAAFRTRKRYKKQTGVGKGTQGATSGASEMDASGPGSPKPGSNSSSNPASPAIKAASTPSTKASSAAARKKQSKKKKKGGW